jgi:hypothetical protein
MTNAMRRTPSIGPDIEAGEGNEAHIPGTKIELWTALLDTPMRRTLSIGHGIEGADVKEAHIPGTKNTF